MSKKSVRVQLDSEHQKILSCIALAHGCLYAGKGNISLLLEKIATGILEVKHPVLPQDESKKKISNELLIGLELKLLSDLNGIIAVVAEKIGDYKGNIYDIKARDRDPKMRITLHIPHEVDLNDLIADLKQITVKELLEYNRQEKKEKLLKEICSERKRVYDLLKEEISENNAEKIESLIDKSLENFHQEKVITDIFLTIALRAEIKHQPGNLSILAKALAKKHISILEIDQKLDDNEQNNIADLFLGFYPYSQIKPIKEIRNIKKFTEHLKKLNCIENIYQLNIHYFNH